MAAISERVTELQQKAISGNLDAQRKLAGCYEGACPGMASTDPVLACAWRIVMVASGHAQLTGADVEARRRGCEGLGLEERSAAIKEAKGIFARIHGRELPLPADFLGGPRLAPGK